MPRPAARRPGGRTGPARPRSGPLPTALLAAPALLTFLTLLAAPAPADEPADEPARGRAPRTLSAAFAAATATPELFADDDPPAWVAVRAPRSEAERSVIPAALAWWAAEEGAEERTPPAAVRPAAVRPAAGTTPAAPAVVAALAWWSPRDEAAADSQSQEDSRNGAEQDDEEPGAEEPADDERTADRPTAADGRDEQEETDEDGGEDGGEDEEPAGPTACDRLACLFPPMSELDAGLNSPTAVLAKRVRAVEEDGCERLVPVEYREVERPGDVVGPCFAAAGAIDATPYGRRPRPLAMTFRFAHRPLYFEDPNLERCGVTACPSCPCVQPLVSAAHFYGTIPLLPWWAASRPPNGPVPAAPFCPPGCRYDACQNYLPPAEVSGALGQAAATAAFFLIFP